MSNHNACKKCCTLCFTPGVCEPHYVAAGARGAARPTRALFQGTWNLDCPFLRTTDFDTPKILSGDLGWAKFGRFPSCNVASI
jgi:hypothetical protein